MNTGNKARLAQLQAVENIALRRAAEIARLEELLANRPEQPAADSVVSFERTYDVNGKSYSWVAYQAIEGWWYLSQSGYGARTLPRMNWDDLLDFIGDNTIYIATAWEIL